MFLNGGATKIGEVARAELELGGSYSELCENLRYFQYSLNNSFLIFPRKQWECI